MESQRALGGVTLVGEGNSTDLVASIIHFIIIVPRLRRVSSYVVGLSGLPRTRGMVTMSKSGVALVDYASVHLRW